MKPISYRNRFRYLCSFMIFTFCLVSSVLAQNETEDAMVSKIRTEVDSNYVYDYEKTKFVPPAGKTLLIMGQTEQRIKEYKRKFPEQPNPGGWSAYWAITEFVGVTKKHTNSTGTSQNHQMLVSQFPNSALHSAMWMVGKWSVTENTILGIYDPVIKRYANWVKTINRPVYLRIGYEFDGPHNVLEPKDYVRAYRHIVDVLRAEGVDNIAYVWHSYAAAPYKNYPLSDWYPGDDYVDWVGISIFGHAYSKTGLNKEGEAVLDFAKAHKKPVMIAESNPIFGIEADNPKVWDDWFVNYFSLVYEKNIKAICFINEDWTLVNIEGLSKWKDAKLYNNELVSKAWFKETDKDKYLKASSKLFEQLGYE
ncbi:glycoside hydrolase family 26 protein [Hyunsoonleella rubra]|uniref:Glycoside hydrolase family 26 protein n=1 Tax=Hyunsoonleella rubra TaxID=1737062 RepID=A0ABW5TCK4_9FLAO